MLLALHSHCCFNIGPTVDDDMVMHYWKDFLVVDICCMSLLGWSRYVCYDQGHMAVTNWTNLRLYESAR